MSNRRSFVLGLPQRIRDGELIEILQDRFRRIEDIFGSLPGVGGILDMRGNRIINVGNPVGARDAVNLQFLRSFVGSRSSTTVDGSVEDSTRVGVTGAAIEIVRLPLTVDPTIVAVAGASEGLIVYLWLEQDATGGRTVTWPTGWDGFTAETQPDPTADLCSLYVVQFFSSTTARLAAIPLLGLPKTNTP